jgi:hypothetical protein
MTMMAPPVAVAEEMTMMAPPVAVAEERITVSLASEEEK